jgi:hypothetical protein
LDRPAKVSKSNNAINKATAPATTAVCPLDFALQKENSFTARTQGKDMSAIMRKVQANLNKISSKVVACFSVPNIVGQQVEGKEGRRSRGARF